MIPQQPLTSRQPPTLRYCGVTIELAYPGRFDRRELIDGPSGYALKEALEGTRLNRYAFDIRTVACDTPYLAGTRVVLLCGEFALSKIGQPRTRMNVLRGSPFVDQRGIVFIPTYHPQDAVDRKNFEAHLNQHAIAQQDEAEEIEREDTSDVSVKDIGKTARRNYRFWFIHDVRKAVDIARTGYQPNKATYHTSLDAKELLATMELGTRTEGELFIDIETDFRSGRMLCFAFSYDARDIYCVPVINHRGELHFSKRETLEILRSIVALFAKRRVVVHNALFDLFILAWRYRIPPPPQEMIFDTMLAQSRLHVDVEKSLGHCVSLYTQQPYHKDEGIFTPSNHTQYQQLLTYNAKDVETMALIYYEQNRLAEKDPGLRDSIAQVNSLVAPLLLKSLRGVPVDTSALCARIDELNTRTKWLEINILNRLAGQEVNPRSPKQIAALLYEKLGLPKSLDPRLSLTGKDALYRLALKYPIPTLKVILECRKASKEAGFLSCRLWRESYITCSYAPAGTKTFRLSSRALLGTWGTNLQNWSKRTRKMVISRPGWVLVQVDQSGAEALIVAYLATAGRYRDLFLHGVNPHVYTAARLFPEVWKSELGYDIQYLFEMPVGEAKKDARWPEIARCIKASDDNPPSRRYYYLGKKTNHSGNYAVEGPSLAMAFLRDTEGQISLPVIETTRFLRVYNRDLYPEIPGSFQAGVLLDLENKRELRNLFGYPRKFYGNTKNPDESTKKDAYSWIPQSTVGCITCRADSALQLRVDRGELNMEILQNGHDSLLIHCPEGEYQKIAQVVKQAMNQQMTSPRGEIFEMKSDASVGVNWFEMSSIK